MIKTGNATGQAIYIRTDTSEYAETAIPFHTLEELAAICASHKPNLNLEKVIIFHSRESLTTAITLDFICASQRSAPGRNENVT